MAQFTGIARPLCLTSLPTGSSSASIGVVMPQVGTAAAYGALRKALVEEASRALGATRFLVLNAT